MDKKELRRKYKAIRSAIIDKEDRSKLMCQTLLQHPKVIESNTISVFVSYSDEINTHQLIESLLSINKIVVVPYINEDDTMVMKRMYSLTDLVSKDKYGIEIVNSSNPTIDKSSIDLVIVPGLAFDKEGNRLGYGKGYYDRYLSDSSINTIGVGYKEQLCDSLPSDESDVKIGEILVF